MNQIAKENSADSSYKKNPSWETAEHDLEYFRPVGNQGVVVAEEALLRKMVTLRSDNLLGHFILRADSKQLSIYCEMK